MRTILLGFFAGVIASEMITVAILRPGSNGPGKTVVGIVLVVMFLIAALLEWSKELKAGWEREGKLRAETSCVREKAENAYSDCTCGAWRKDKS